MASGHQRDTGHHPLDTHPAAGFRQGIPLMEAYPVAQAVSAIPEWEWADLSVPRQEPEGSDLTGAYLEVEDYPEEVAEVFPVEGVSDLTAAVSEAEDSQEEVAEVFPVDMVVVDMVVVGVEDESIQEYFIVRNGEGLKRGDTDEKTYPSNCTSLGDRMCGIYSWS